MRERILLVLSIILAVSGIVFAQQTTTRTVTNADLEKFRQKRVKAEKEYRASYRRRGMPSPEEIERIEAERQERLSEFAQQAQIRREENQSDIRQRAAALKNEITSVEAQIAYLQGESSNQRSSYLGGNVWSPSPYGVIVPGYGRGGFGWGGYRGGINPFPRQNRNGWGYPRYRGGYVIPLGNNGDAEAEDLKSRLSNLEQIRAGLLAQWSDLEDEARQAGVRID